MAGVRGKSLFTLLESTVARLGSSAAARTAVASPFQAGTPFQQVSYEALRNMTVSMSSIIAERSSRASGAKKVLVCDLPNVCENLLLQLACSRLGIGYLTTKDDKSLETVMSSKEEIQIVAAIPATVDSWLAKNDALAKVTSVVQVEELFSDLANHSSAVVMEDSLDDAPHGYFNTVTSPLRNSQLVPLALAAESQLQLTESDSVLVSITLCHQFGIASGVGAALAAGSKIVLPAVGGIRGCGVPAERAEAVRQVLKDEKVTVLFSDAPVIKQLGDKVEAPALRTGVVKVGSGADFLDEKIQLAGVPLWTMGKKTTS